MADRALKKSIEKAIQNPVLTGTLGRFSEAYVIARAKAYEGIDFEELRSRIAEIKRCTAEHLYELAEEFKKNAEAKGAKVFITNDTEKIKEYILNVAKEKGVRSIIKSKSMASEEIHLNSYLEKEGIEVNETDLGEWIIQLAKQKPSHMVLPAIHITKEEIGELFSKKINEEVRSEIPELVKVARKQLRDKFLNADMGISGANIAVAETGSIVIIENEGNAGLVTTLPKIHIALVGLEKLVANFSDVVPILTALPKSATGQLFTSYVSIITGQSLNTDSSFKDLHIILIDNKRTEMARDPIFKEAFQCIRCASCLNVCPVFRLVGGHVFGHVYTGPIGIILTAWFNGFSKAMNIQQLCIQCGRCKEFCPGKIDIPGLILEIRGRIVKEKGMPFIQKSIFSIVNNRRLFHSILRKASLLQRPFVQEGFIRHLPMFFTEIADYRSLPAIAEISLRDRIKDIKQGNLEEKAVFFAGCLIDFVYPEIGEAVIKILNKAGIEVIFPEEQTCCGAPARYSGALDVADKIVINNINALLKEDVQYIVSACPTCAVSLKYGFISALKTYQKNSFVNKAKEFASKIYDFSSLIYCLVKTKRLKIKSFDRQEAITYHDSCHLKRTLNVYLEPREVLTTAKYEIREMFESDMCCGMGGYYSIKFPEISKALLQRKLKNIRDTKTEMVVMDCPGCVMQIRGGFDKEKDNTQVKHLAEVIVKGI